MLRHNKYYSYFIAVIVALSITLNVKVSDSPPIYLSNILIAIISVFMLMNVILVYKEKTIADILPVFYLCILISIVAFFYKNNPNNLIVYPKLIIGIVTYYAFSRFFIFNRKYISIILVGFCLGVGFSPYFQVSLTDFTTIGVSNRLRVENLGNYNAYGFLIAVALVISAYLFNIIKSRTYRLIFLTIQSPLLVVLLYTSSRGGMLALIVGLAIFYLTNNIKSKFYFAIATTIMIITLVFVLQKNDTLESFLDRFLISNQNSDNFDSGRSVIYLMLINELISSPFNLLFGFGIGAIDIQLSNTELIQSAHNTYLDVVYSFGIIGGILLVVYLFSLYKSLKFRPKSLEKSLLMSLFGQIILAFMYDSYWGATQIGWIFPFLFAFISTRTDNYVVIEYSSTPLTKKHNFNMYRF